MTVSRRDILLTAGALPLGGMALSQANAQEGSVNMMSGGEIDAVEFGQSLKGFGVNFLVTDISKTVEFSKNILGADVVMVDDGFAILRRGEMIWMLHGDETYHSNPLQGFVMGKQGRGQGIELRLYNLDPDDAEARAREADYVILSATANKPHGLRECYILDPDGYCWVPSRALRDGEE